MQNVLGIIFADNINAKVKELSEVRPVAALPVAGRYRIIDFVLSNMVNSGMTNVAIVTTNNYHSLMGHLGSGKQWNLARKRFGLTMFPPFSNLDSQSSDSRIDMLYGLLGFLRRSPQEYVLLSEGNFICNKRFNKMFEFHKANNNDITVCTRKANEEEKYNEKENFVISDENNNITGIDIGGNTFVSDQKFFGAIIINKQTLIQIIESSKVRGKKGYLTNLVARNINKLNMKTFELQGYANMINNINDYYNVNMELLDEEIAAKLFSNKNPIYTKDKDSAPVMYQENAEVSNCFIADGSVIDGKVSNSLIFRNVQIKKGSVIKNSIIMQDSIIGENVTLENVIIDKKVVIKDNKKLIGDKTFPVVVSKGKVI